MTYVTVYIYLIFLFLTKKYDKSILLNNNYRFSLMNGFFFIYILVIIGLRYNVGADYIAYEDIFGKINSNQNVPFVEPFFLYVLGMFSSYEIFIFLSTLFYLGALFLVFGKKTSDSKFVIILYFLLVTGLVANVSFIRQSIALSIILYSFYLWEDSKLKLIIASLIASLFHVSALLFLVVVFIPRRKFNLVQLTIFLLINIVIYIIDIQSIIVNYSFLLGDYSGYIKTSMFSSTSGTGGLAVFAFAAFFCLYILSKVKDEDKNTYLICNLGLIYIFLLMITIKIPLAFRLNIYFAPFFVMGLDFLISKSRVKQKEIIRIMLIIINTIAFIKLFSVESFNDAIIPYQTILDII